LVVRTKSNNILAIHNFVLGSVYRLCTSLAQASVLGVSFRLFINSKAFLLTAGGVLQAEKTAVCIMCSERLSEGMAGLMRCSCLNPSFPNPV
jgi:hypothetical protein